MIIKSVLLELLPFLLMIVTGGFTVRVTNKHVGRHRARVAVRERIRDAEEDSRQFLKPEDLEYLATWDRILGIHTAKEPEPSASDIVPVILPTPTQGPKAPVVRAEQRTKEYRGKVLADIMENQKEARRQQESFEAARLRDDTAIEGMRARNRAAENAELAREAGRELTVDQINEELQRLQELHQKHRDELVKSKHLAEGLRQEANHWKRKANDKALTELNKPRPRPSQRLTPRRFS